jgi:flagellar protein FlgJ
MEIGRVNNSLGYNNTSVGNAIRQTEGEIFEERLKAAMKAEDKKELEAVCQEFEGIILNMMFRQMKATVPKSELFPGNTAREVYESMLDDSLMEEAAKNGGIGLGETLFKQLSRFKEGAQDSAINDTGRIHRREP